MGDSAATDRPDLMVIYDGHTSIRHAADGAFIIGRDQPPSDVSIDHFAVSRVHARLIPGEKQWLIVDYESLNGIYIDGVRVRHSTPVVDGMTVHLANPKGIAITFRYVHPEDITAPATATAPAVDAPAQTDPPADEPELTRYEQATAQLEKVIKDVMVVPAPGRPGAARTMLRLLQQLGKLRVEFADLAVDEDMGEARALLTCVEAMYHGLVIRMSVCA
ncbi:FHA domain-containing protein [Mycolicibacterium sp. CBMA 226]|uniref:FHA domain-containing protein n=1 Tax=Mycolicibacterium sp. CBMA 226 TaxID=2606611 RepID=UPI0012DE1A6F|nr:FHA domain-containing protein [Mycolicibacterium sp. CBMA 226]MUL78895.1 FHA domain-containing protein [Mycolicibacterium sp. CBMA 226]QGW61194.1 ABC transporter ATP-binding/permease protein [Mycolicibacterium sp.]